MSCRAKRGEGWEIGSKFGLLMIVGLAERQPGTRHDVVRCLCECGKELDVKVTLLRTGRKRSCGRHRKEDLVGSRYGRWLVLAPVSDVIYSGNRSKVAWLCRCDCGTERVVIGDVLRRGDSLSCGCYKSEVVSVTKLKNLAGLRFGKLLVVERDLSKQTRRTMWKCLCDCGKTRLVMSENLLSGNSTSCGSGPCHGLWNSALTDEDRLAGRLRFRKELEEWRKAVLQRDNYTCRACGKRGGKLAAHHLDGWNWCVERRFDVSNGVPLCNAKGGCHKVFHSRYGRGGNTEEQFTEFIGGLPDV